MDIRLENICKSYGSHPVLSGFSCSFPKSAAICILGPSGCGKTTLLGIIAGLIPADSGTIEGVGDKKISAVFQEDRLFENLSAQKNVLLTAKKGFTRADACALLQELGITEDTSSPVRSYSGGMKRRVAIARALAADYDILLLDEPMSGLDADTRALALDVIRRRSAGKAIICVTHDPADAIRLEAHLIRL